MNKPLSGIKVVELATFVAGPVTARLLADLGADVIKVEAPAGDAWRQAGISMLPQFSEQENPVFDIYNTGKRHISLNLKTQEGIEAFHKLLAQADVFVTNTRPAALKRLGLSYEELKDKYPSLIYAIILGYGENGPDSHKVAFDQTAFWSRSGFLRDLSVKSENYYPVVAPSSVGDTATGYLLMGEITTALFNRTRTGKGDFVSSTLYHNGIFCMGTMAIITQPPFGKQYPVTRVDAGCPEGAFECSDGEWIFISPGNPDITYPRFHRIIGHPELTDDPRFNSENRWENREIYYRFFRDAFLTKPADEWVRLADEADVPLVRMCHFSDISTDEQAWANHFLENVSFPNGSTNVMPTSPLEFGSTTMKPTKPAPELGADTVAVLASLGYTPEQIQHMLETKAAIAPSN